METKKVENSEETIEALRQALIGVKDPRRGPSYCSRSQNVLARILLETIASKIR